MKRFLTLMLVVALVFAIAAPVFADDTFETEEGGESKFDVTADFTAHSDTKGETVYKMTIAWEMGQGNNLAYTAEQAVYKWNTDSLTYTLDTDSQDYTAAGWSGSASVVITVTNFSDAEVEATVDATNEYQLKVTAPKTNETLKSAALKEDGSAIDFFDVNTEGTEYSAEFTYTFEPDTDSLPIDDTASNSAYVISNVTVTVEGGN